MRCPKCGYISFDQQPSCKKCSADLTAISASLPGTGLKAQEIFFLASLLEGAAEAEEREYDLSDMAVDEEVELLGPEPAESEEVPVVNLAPFAAAGTAGEEEEEISLTLPGEDEEEVEAAAEEEEDVLGGQDESGGIEFSMGEEEMAGLNVDLLLDRDKTPAAKTVAPESPSGEELQGGIEFQLEEEEPVTEAQAAVSFAEEEEPGRGELDLEEAEEQAGGIDFDLGLMPEIEMEEAASDEDEAQTPPAGKSDSSLKLDLDVDLDDEPEGNDLVFNLEDIDMDDLLIPANGAGKKGRPEDTALDLEDFLNEGKESGDQDGADAKAGNNPARE